jgi:N-acetylglucosamine kinase-like BadF-type ATPase
VSTNPAGGGAAGEAQADTVRADTVRTDAVQTGTVRAGTVLAIDGGNSKTDVVLVDAGGNVIATARSGGFTPQSSGVAAAVAVAAEAVRLIRAELGVPEDVPVARHLAAYVAGADLPFEEEALAVAFRAQGWADTVEVSNDTFALLRAGASRPWGVAVVCGAGINCAGIGPDGRRARFPALGRLTGDWGGGHYLGEETLWSAIRGEDGRGPATALSAAVSGHFGRETVERAALAIYFGEIDNERLHELVPVLMRVAGEGDAVALSIVDRMAEEVVTMARVALTRLDIADRPAEVVLGGGVLRARVPVLMDLIAARAAVAIPLADLVIAADPPVVGAALLGLDALGLTEPAGD